MKPLSVILLLLGLQLSGYAQMMDTLTGDRRPGFQRFFENDSVNFFNVKFKVPSEWKVELPSLEWNGYIILRTWYSPNYGGDQFVDALQESVEREGGRMSKT